MAFTFAIAANVIAAIASLLTGRRIKTGGARESLGGKLAAVAAEGGGIEPSELVVTDVVSERNSRGGDSRAVGGERAVIRTGRIGQAEPG